MTIDTLTLFHVFALVIGLGGATYSDLLLFHFLNDLKISAKEAEILRFMGNIVLAGVVLAAVSGLLLFNRDPAGYLDNPKFLAKAVIFGVIVVNGLVLHRYTMPRLLSIAFDEKHRAPSEYWVRRFAFVFGAVSVVSWYSVFVLGFVTATVYSVFQILLGYTMLLALGVLSALLVERVLQYMADSEG